MKIYIVTGRSEEDSDLWVYTACATQELAQKFIDNEKRHWESVVWNHNREDDIRYEKAMEAWRAEVAAGGTPRNPWRNQWHNDEHLYYIEEYELVQS